MIKCSKCDFEAKSEFGLKAHMRKHKNELSEENKVEEKKESITEAINTDTTATYSGPESGSVMVEAEPIKETSKKAIAKLINREGNVVFIFSLEKNGQEWIDLAMKVVEKKKLKIEFE